MKYKKVIAAILKTYIDQERENKFSEPELGDAAYNLLEKTSKGRIIDTFMNQKVVSLPVNTLVTTCRGHFYSLESFLWKIDDKEPIHVVKYKGKFLVLDGRHRLMIHKILSKRKIKARLIDLDKKRKKKK